MAFDPAVSLAIALASGPGRYALLLGSGVSRSAGIPTGWEVTLDLIVKVATAQDGEAPADAEEWWRTHHSKAPEYSELLTDLAPLPAERAQLLRSYFEPTPEERETGIKLPSPAHRAIARLVAAGVVRVIVTTNFDRLLEQAIQEEGIAPVVISTADQADGASPLTHNPCTIIKVNGDYLDSRIKNSEEELSSYDSRIDKLLDRVLDDYGLIVCGWSGDWDIALRDALERAPNRRYTTYWTLHSEPSERASGLIAHREATCIPIENADRFFVTLADRVESLMEVADDPESTAVAVAQLKRYLTRTEDRIRLADLLRTSTEDLVRATAEEHFPVSGSVTNDNLVQRVHAYERLTSRMLHLTATTAYWGENEHSGEVISAIHRVASAREPGGGLVVLINLTRYPALLMLYAAGVAYVATGRYRSLHELLTRPVRTSSGRTPLMVHLHPWAVVDDGVGQLVRGGGQRYYTPASDQLFEVLREPFRDLIPSDEAFQEAFDRFELFLALLLWDEGRQTNSLSHQFYGAFSWRGTRRGSDWMPVIVGQEIEDAGTEWEPLRAGLFGGDLSRAAESYESYREWLQRNPRF